MDITKKHKSITVEQKKKGEIKKTIDINNTDVKKGLG